jgi:Tfp pilus assembly protein PilN
MARGWESKSIESQIESAEPAKKKESKVSRSAAEIDRLREQESLVLSRTRVLHQMESCQNPRYRVILDKALADLDSRLAKLGLRRAATG